MKTFSTLTEEQQKKAVAFAQKELEEALSVGTIIAGVQLSSSEIEELAIVAAEESNYDDEGNAVMGGMDVPYHFVGDKEFLRSRILKID